MFGFLKTKLKSDGIAAPFPEAWRTHLTARFPIYARLTAPDRAELERRIQQFLATKRFEGCGGFEVTDEARVLIAAQACLLLLRRDTECYPELTTVLVYPDTYVAKTRWNEDDEDTSPGDRARLGETWSQGSLVLSWSSAAAGASNITDGQNVVMHEFAHQLDVEDGTFDGTPPLGGTGIRDRYHRYMAWAQVLGAEFQKLQRVCDRGAKSVLSCYGATNSAEFFAVATECFFEKPRALQRKHPELYAELKGFYGQDPVAYTISPLPNTGPSPTG